MQRLRGRGIRLEQYREDGTLEAILEADEALIDRATKLVVAKGHVHADMSGDQLDGNGAVADVDARYVKILSHATITTSRMGEVDFANRGLF